MAARSCSPVSKANVISSFCCAVAKKKTADITAITCKTTASRNYTPAMLAAARNMTIRRDFRFSSARINCYVSAAKPADSEPQKHRTSMLTPLLIAQTFEFKFVTFLCLAISDKPTQLLLRCVSIPHQVFVMFFCLNQ